MHERARRKPLTREAAETIAARALLFLADDAGRLGRFLAETGLDPATLKAELGSPEVMAAGLAQLMADESALLAFAANAGLQPEDVAKAEAMLGGGAAREST